MKPRKSPTVLVCVVGVLEENVINTPTQFEESVGVTKTKDRGTRTGNRNFVGVLEENVINTPTRFEESVGVTKIKDRGTRMESQKSIGVTRIKDRGTRMGSPKSIGVLEENVINTPTPPQRIEQNRQKC